MTTLQIAQNAFQMGEITKAETICKNLLSITQDGSAHHLLGLILAKTGRFNEGVGYLEKSLSTQPNNAHFLNNIGIIFKDNGNIDTAESLYRCAIENMPNFAQPYFNLGLLLGDDSSRIDESLQMYTKALEIDRNFAMAFNNRGNLLRDLNRSDEAKFDFERALAIDGSMAISHFNLGNIYFDRHDFDRALDCYKKSLQCDSNYEDADNNIAACYSFLGQLEKAIVLYDKLIKKYGLKAIFVSGLASVFEKKGDKNKAVEVLKQVLPQDIEDHTVLTQVIKLLDYMDYEPSQIADLAEKVYINNISKDKVDPNVTGFIYAIGDLFKLLGDYDKSFNYYTLANESYQAVYNNDEMLNKANNIISSYKILDKSIEGPSSGKIPVFIVGMPRSGSTLVESILGSHSQIVTIGEATFLAEIETEICERLGLNHIEDGFGLLSKDIRCEFAGKYFSKIQSAGFADGDVYVDKNLFNFWRIPLIKALFPKAQIIHCYRHPLDTILSIYSLSYIREMSFSGKLEDIANYYINYAKVMCFFENKNDLNLIQLSHQDMVNNAQAKIENILSLCDLKWQDNCLEFYKSDRYLRTASYNQVRQPINNKGIGRWLKYKKHLGVAIDVLSNGGIALEGI